MRILITSGIVPPHIGGPAQYALHLAEELRRKGHTVSLYTYRFEHRLPSGIRHLLFFFRILIPVRRSDMVITLDTFSVGFPSVCVAWLCNRKILLRTGGDFLWELYAERTQEKVLLRDFYTTRFSVLCLKEKIIFYITKWTLHHLDSLIFSTTWQRDIWNGPYALDGVEIHIIENQYLPADASDSLLVSKQKVFITGTRHLVWKNKDLLQRVFDDIKETHTDVVMDNNTYPPDVFLKKIQDAYAVVLVSLGDISPNMVLEALRFGVPCIVTKECGILDRIQDYVNVVDPLSYDDIKENIRILLDDVQYKNQRDVVGMFSFTHTYKDIAEEFLAIASL